MTEPNDNSTDFSPASAANAADNTPRDDFAREVDQPPRTLILEFIDFLCHDKKWWLTPIIVVLLLLASLMFLSTTAVAPFIYPIW